jgi:dolichyl-phosphate beta-glucosyltransferase
VNLPLERIQDERVLPGDLQPSGALFEPRPTVHTSLCVVIPMFNEANRIDGTLAALAQSPLNRADVRLLFVDDGSTDSSAEVVLARARSHPFVRPVDVSLDRQNRGKGAAVRRGVLEALRETGLETGRGTGLATARATTREVGTGAPHIAFLDADLSLDPAMLDAALVVLTEAKADVVVGNRVVDRTRQPKLRRVVSLVFRQLTRAVAPTGVADTQCACKVFTADAAERIFGPLETNGFAFDVEVLLRARREQMRVVEIDVAWQHTPGSRVNPLVESIKMTRDVMRVRRRLSRR